MVDKLARALLILCVPVLLVATPLYVLVTPAYAHRAYARPDFPPSSRFTPAERQRLSDVLILYLRGRATLEEMAALSTDAGETALLPSEVQHMVDVKQVMDGFFIAHGIALVVATVASVVLLRSTPLGWARAMRGGILVTAAVLAVVAVSAVADFDLFFTLFHQIFFEEGTWIFAYEDTLIQLYPLPFWTRAVADMLLAMAALAAPLYAASWWLTKRTLGRISR